MDSLAERSKEGRGHTLKTLKLSIIFEYRKSLEIWISGE